MMGGAIFVRLSAIGGGVSQFGTPMIYLRMAVMPPESSSEPQAFAITMVGLDVTTKRAPVRRMVACPENAFETSTNVSARKTG